MGNFFMTTLSATRARSDFFELIKNVIKKHQLYQINHREGNVVMISEEDYEGLIETLELLSAPNFKKKYKKAKKEIATGKIVTFEKVFGTLTS